MEMELLSVTKFCNSMVFGLTRLLQASSNFFTTALQLTHHTKHLWISKNWDDWWVKHLRDRKEILKRATGYRVWQNGLISWARWAEYPNQSTQVRYLKYPTQPRSARWWLTQYTKKKLSYVVNNLQAGGTKTYRGIMERADAKSRRRVLDRDCCSKGRYRTFRAQQTLPLLLRKAGQRMHILKDNLISYVQVPRFQHMQSLHRNAKSS